MSISPVGYYPTDPTYEKMSLRDYMAAQAMQNVFRDCKYPILLSDNELEKMAKQVYRVADAILKAREDK